VLIAHDVPIVSSNTQLLDALLIMSQKALGMVLITHDETLQGIFTDGRQRQPIHNITTCCVNRQKTTTTTQSYDWVDVVFRQ
jgi:hypothetical protein